jgi:hypothetical protein
MAAIIAAVLIAAPAIAQQPTPTPPASAPTAATPIAKPGCTRPEDHPGRLASDLRKKSWSKEVQEYVECMKKFADEQKAVGDAHYAAANNAINSLNKDIVEFNEQSKRAAGQ